MDKIMIEDKFGRRTVWVMTTCPNHKALVSKHSTVKPTWKPAERLMINDKPYTSITDASARLKVSRYTVTLRVKSKLKKWARWTRLNVPNYAKEKA